MSRGISEKRVRAIVDEEIARVLQLRDLRADLVDTSSRGREARLEASQLHRKVADLEAKLAEREISDA